MLELFVLETCPYCKKVMRFLDEEHMKYNKIDYYSMINISNFSELEKAAIIYAYDFETIARFCEKYEIKFSNIVDEFHEKRNKIEGEIFIPLEVIESYSKNIIPPTYEENFDEIIVLNNYKEF